MDDALITKLALMYLQNHQDKLTTPEDYIDEFKRVKQAMKDHLPKPKVSGIPAMPANRNRLPQ